MRRPRRGFSIVEILIASTMAMVVLTAATTFGVKSWQARRGWVVKEGVDRNARYVGLSLARDAQEAGIALESTPVFGSVATFGDTISVLAVPFTTVEAPVYPIYNDGGASATYPAGGTCGADCIDFRKVGGTYTLAAGQIALLQVGSERRLLFLTQVTNFNSSRFRIKFKPVNRFLGRESGLDSVLLERAGTTLQQLDARVYWRDAGSRTLYRAQGFNADGSLKGFALATDVEAWTATLLFTDGGESNRYDGMDSDTTNDGNKIIGLKVRTRIKSDKIDPAVNNGAPYYRWYEWRVAPRNLLYEKNRMG